MGDDNEQENSLNLIYHSAVYVCKHTSYKLEEVFNQNIDWLNMMVKEISAQEFERNILELQMHGMDKKVIDRVKKEFYGLYPEKARQFEKKNKPVNINSLSKLGMKVIRKPKAG